MPGGRRGSGEPASVRGGGLFGGCGGVPGGAQPQPAVHRGGNQAPHGGAPPSHAPLPGPITGTGGPEKK
eukprot:158126-Prorocentrum_minimum.AAC.1